MTFIVLLVFTLF